MSVLIFRFEKLSKLKIISCIIGFAGVLPINLNGAKFDCYISLMGKGFIFLSTISYAASSVMIKKYIQAENPVALSGYQFIFRGLVMIVAGFAMGEKLNNFTIRSTLLLIYMAIISAAAYSIWSILLKHNPVSRVAVFGFMNPIFDTILSAILLK